MKDNKLLTSISPIHRFEVRAFRIDKKRKALNLIREVETKRHEDAMQDKANSPFVEALMDRMAESETCIVNIQKHASLCDSIDNEAHQLQRDMIKHAKEIQQTFLEAEGVLAIRQICIALFQKIITEVAGDRRDKWDMLAIDNLKVLDGLYRLPVGRDYRQEDLDYFSKRWETLKVKLGVTHTSRQLHSFSKISKKGGNDRAHEEYEFNVVALKAEATKHLGSPYDKNFMILLEMNDRLSTIRKESIYKASTSVVTHEIDRQLMKKKWDSAVEACRAHNPKVGGSKPLSAIYESLIFLT